jgi:hypothetical protein
MQRWTFEYQSITSQFNFTVVNPLSFRFLFEMHGIIVMRFLQVQLAFGQRILVLEQAPEFLQRWALGFGIEEPDNCSLDCEPHNIDDVESAGCQYHFQLPTSEQRNLLPPDVLYANWVHESNRYQLLVRTSGQCRPSKDSLVERASAPREELCKCDALRSVNKREDLCYVDISQRVHDRVEHVVDENHANDRAGRLLGMRLCVVCARARPTSEDSCHPGESDKVLGTAVELLCQKCAGHAGDEVPAGQAQVDLVLLAAVCDAYCGEHFG